MGCWNETDALTQLPILSGDPVKLIVVSSTPDDSDDLILPRCFPISGKYNDYGNIEYIQKDWATDAFVTYCNDQFKGKKWGFVEGAEARMSAFAVKYPFSGISSVLHAIERGFVVSHEFGTTMPLFFVMMHDVIYDKALKMGGSYTDYHEDPFLQRMQKVVQRAMECEDKMPAHIAEFEDERQRKVLMTGVVSSRLSETLFRITGSLGGSYIREVYGDSCFGGLIEKTTAPADDYIKRLLDLACLMNFLTITRRKLYKQAGSGSQDCELLMASEFLDFAKTFALDKHYALEEDKQPFA